MEHYKISVPLRNPNLDIPNREYTMELLKRSNIERVFIAIAPVENKELQERIFSDLKSNISFFKENGFEVGVWVLSSVVRDGTGIQPRINDAGDAAHSWRCHLDEKLLKLHEHYAASVARCGADLLMYDDDLHFGHTGSKDVPGCFCPLHEALLKEMFGPEHSLEEIRQNFWSSPRNKYKDMWYAVMAATLENFAKRVRKAANQLNPAMRIGYCVNGSNYWCNGITVEKLAGILAGDTKPFVRLIGAPYWDYFPDYPSRLASVIEFERIQAQLLKDSNVETMTEGDVFPRPRTSVPSAVLECFDLAMRAEGNTTGILKYMLDYNAPADYETGYIENHMDNQDLYLQVQKHFSEKAAVGVRVYNFPEKCTQSDIRYRRNAKTETIMPLEGFLLSQLSIPTTYEGSGWLGAAFGENTRYLSEEALQKGIITDVVGAMVLTEQGIDVGLRNVVGASNAGIEYFGGTVTHMLSGQGQKMYEIEVDDKAEVLSHYAPRRAYYIGELQTMPKTPAAYLYENKDGQRFYVMALDANESIKAVKTLREGFRSYAKSRQLIRACEWITGAQLPVKCVGNPDLYVMCKEDENTVSVGLWNLSKDKIKKPVIELAEHYREAEFISCEGEMQENTVSLSTLYPYEFCGIVLKK